MKQFKAFIFGSEQAGKTEFIKKLHSPQYINSADLQYTPTMGAHFSSITIPTEENEEPIEIELIDMGGQSRYKALTNIYSAKAHLGIYCIDLSKEIDDLKIEEIKADIERFQENSLYARLILVGTKSDIAKPDALEIACQKLADLRFIHAVSINSKTEDGTNALFNLLCQETRKKILTEEEVFIEFYNSAHPILKARNRCAEDSSLYAALNDLDNATQNLQFNVIEGLGEEANILLDQLQDPSLPDKTAVIDSYIAKSNALIQGEHYEIKSIITTIAISALVTVLAGLIGFGIGFALGLWTGPGAFFTGLSAGCASAIAVAGTTSLLGVGTLALTSHSFFKTNPVIKSVKEVAEKATESLRDDSLENDPLDSNTP